MIYSYLFDLNPLPMIWTHRLEDSGSLVGSVWPALEELARPAREKRRLNPGVRDELIYELCSHAPLSVRELAQLLNRTEAYTGDAIRPLVESHHLTFLFPDQPRHPKQRYLAPNSRAEELAERIRAGDLPGALGSAVFHAGVDVGVVSHRGADTDPESELASRIWPHLERMAAVARERRRLAPAVRDRLVLELCSMAPLSARELGILLNRSEAYVADAIHPLVTAGDLGFLYPDQPRHPRQKYVARERKPLDEVLAAAGLSPAAPQPDLADKSDVELLVQLAQLRWSELDHLARPARDDRYLGRSELVSLIEAIAAVAPVSVLELAVLTDRREEYIREVLDGLLAANRLQLLYPDEPAHTSQKVFGATRATSSLQPRADVRAVIEVNQHDLAQGEIVKPPAVQLGAPVPLATKLGGSTPLDEPAPGEIDASKVRARPIASTWNPVTNSLVTVLTGILFGITMPPAWWFYSLLVGGGLATLHVVTGSSQYQRYQALDPSPGRKASFLVLKGLVAFVEILAVALVVSLIHC